jgi:hypothetical protein
MLIRHSLCFLIVLFSLCFCCDQSYAFFGRKAKSDTLTVEPADDVKDEFLNREEKKIEEFQEIQNSFLEKINTQSDSSTTFESASPSFIETPPATDPIETSSESFEYKPTRTVVDEPAVLDLGSEERTVSQIDEPIVIQQPKPRIEEPSSYESPYRSFSSANDASRDASKSSKKTKAYLEKEDDSPKSFFKKQSTSSAQKNSDTQVKYCKSCGREFPVDNPRIFCPHDGTPLQVRNN